MAHAAIHVTALASRRSGGCGQFPGAMAAVSRWAKEGKLPFTKTLGGHRRYPEAKIRELANQLQEEPTA
jgi:hypothetical protein